LNGGVIRIADGRRLMIRLVGSHHYLLLVGHHAVDLRFFLGKVFGIEIEEI
jgi:hypothetical protein